LKETFYDIYEYIYVPFWKSVPFIISIICLAALVTGATTFLFVRARKKRMAKKELSPLETTLLKLKKLSPENLKIKQEYKLFYFKLTEIFKQFLQKDRNWPTEEKTDDELIDYINEKGVDKNLIVKLKKILGGALLVKFANQEALQDQTKNDLWEMISIVKQI